MVEVTSSSSNGVNILNSKNDTQKPFDMRSWQGLTGVLKAAKDAGLTESEYSTFRDLVLSYAQSGGDVALKTKIDILLLIYFFFFMFKHHRKFFIFQINSLLKIFFCIKFCIFTHITSFLLYINFFNHIIARTPKRYFCLF